MQRRTYVRRLDPEKGVHKLFENVLCKGRIQNFFKRVEGDHILTFFRQSCFETNRGTKTALGGSGNATLKIF